MPCSTVDDKCRKAHVAFQPYGMQRQTVVTSLNQALNWVCINDVARFGSQLKVGAEEQLHVCLTRDHIQ
jgi:hypothetical protein